MPVQIVQDPEEVFEAITESLKPVVVHYWAPWMGGESPFMPVFLGADENRGGEEIDFVIVDSGFIHPAHSPDEMPLTVLYHGGEEVDSAPFDPEAVEALIEGV
ncbi:hypothetical protein DTO013E5_6379 [Penicillium roqueforti]|uniref:Thioredoxin-like fold n=1 Tax=Penicillium roqueforti (strain FM164) TaxID=1365484 RepID=W6QNA5_PENRF|nr:uncharacterized protein LCP9604111_5347 [Penicillium roqueforti]CDM37870.1 Thioredoxin-like fold [Penicillium roqueforti FM164]KAF9248597.1 hypothetical protein LCP9604111_5347 [Penicillium roqueforti]KAI2674192.1 hypothetical protein CBS147355_7367 [Penicillium roqueforti]KAI2682042.1 hypothetical protein LCP963914a_6457 [Penicillium roqueforti]KAI2699175.1 hypothetical protein CBS147372_6422 [Penicillium roqueforti]